MTMMKRMKILKRMTDDDDREEDDYDDEDNNDDEGGDDDNDGETMITELIIGMTRVRKGREIRRGKERSEKWLGRGAFNRCFCFPRRRNFRGVYGSEQWG